MSGWNQMANISSQKAFSRRRVYPKSGGPHVSCQHTGGQEGDQSFLSSYCVLSQYCHDIQPRPFTLYSKWMPLLGACLSYLLYDKPLQSLVVYYNNLWLFFIVLWLTRLSWVVLAWGFSVFIVGGRLRLRTDPLWLYIPWVWLHHPFLLNLLCLLCIPGGEERSCAPGSRWILPSSGPGRSVCYTHQ